MKRLNVFDKYETPYSWKESVRSGVPRKKEKPYPRGLVTALQLGLAAIAVCAIGVFVMLSGFDNFTTGNNDSSSHSGDANSVVSKPNANPDSTTEYLGNSITGNVVKFRSNGYMIIRQGSEYYNVKVPSVVISDGEVISLTDDVKEFAQTRFVSAKISHNSQITRYNGDMMYPQIDNTYALTLDLSLMPDNYFATTAPDDEEILMENAYNAYCASFSGYNNAYSDKGYEEFVEICKQKDEKLVGRFNNNSDFEFIAITPTGVHANKYSVINPAGEIAYEYRYVFALRSKDGSNALENFNKAGTEYTLATNYRELKENGLSIINDNGEMKVFFFSSNPDTMYIVVALRFDSTHEIVNFGAKSILEDAVPFEFVIGKLSDEDINAIADGSASAVCFCENSNTCKHSKTTGSGVFAVSVSNDKSTVDTQ